MEREWYRIHAKEHRGAVVDDGVEGLLHALDPGIGIGLREDDLGIGESGHHVIGEEHGGHARGTLFVRSSY